MGKKISKIKTKLKKFDTIFKGKVSVVDALVALSKEELIAWAQNEIKEWKKFIKLLRSIK
jgi:hypothetical protein